jgi:hypothetical protein
MASPHVVSNPLADRVRQHISQQLARLSQDLEEGEIGPSDAAQRECLVKLAAAAVAMSPDQELALPHLDTGGEGDLSCEWQSDRKVLWLLIAPGGESALHRVAVNDGRVVSRDTTPTPTGEDLRAAIEVYAGGGADGRSHSFSQCPGRCA